MAWKMRLDFRCRTAFKLELSKAEKWWRANEDFTSKQARYLGQVHYAVNSSELDFLSYRAKKQSVTKAKTLANIRARKSHPAFKLIYHLIAAHPKSKSFLAAKKTQQI